MSRSSSACSPSSSMRAVLVSVLVRPICTSVRSYVMPASTMVSSTFASRRESTMWPDSSMVSLAMPHG